MKDGYLDFDEYIRQGEPAQRERAEAWRVAIGYQQPCELLQVLMLYSDGDSTKGYRIIKTSNIVNDIRGF